MKSPRFTGLVAAAFTPMRADGSLNLKPIERLAEHFQQSGIEGVFVSGTTGEGHSLSMEERRRLAAWWSEVARGSALKIIVHVGHNSLMEAKELAAHAQKTGAHAISACCPSYFKPSNVERLVASCQVIASGASNLPFYYYHIPTWTGVGLSMMEFLSLGRKRIPNLAGLKYSDPDIAQFQQCLCAAGGAFDVLYGNDETYLTALTMGGQGVVGSTYNFAAPIYQRILDAFIKCDFETARMEQSRSIELIQTLNHYGYLSAAKAVMSMLGVDCGCPRLPLTPLSPAQLNALRQDLERIEFFDWIGPYHVHARRPNPQSLTGHLPQSIGK